MFDFYQLIILISTIKTASIPEHLRSPLVYSGVRVVQF